MYTKTTKIEIFDKEKISIGDVIELDGMGLDTGVTIRGLVVDVRGDRLKFVELEELILSKTYHESTLLACLSAGRNLKIIL